MFISSKTYFFLSQKLFQSNGSHRICPHSFISAIFHLKSPTINHDVNVPSIFFYFQKLLTMTNFLLSPKIINHAFNEFNTKNYLVKLQTIILLLWHQWSFHWSKREKFNAIMNHFTALNMVIIRDEECRGRFWLWRSWALTVCTLKP